jgi:uncharacterized Ntn-hydrolase superfamily protein
MTYTLIARCPRSGRLGIATASHNLAIGAYCDGAVRPNVGATMTQGAPLARNNRLAINSLALGATPQLALSALRQNDEHFEYRQVAILDREGTPAAHTGSQLRGIKAHRTGSGLVAIGCMLAGESVLDAMIAGFESHPQADFDERLLHALEAGRDAGGLKGPKGSLPERSVAVIVWHRQDYSELDLRVDLQDGAIAALRAMYADYKPTAEYYEERARHPRNALPAMEFADMLKKKRQEQQKAAS